MYLSELMVLVYKDSGDLVKYNCMKVTTRCIQRKYIEFESLLHVLKFVNILYLLNEFTF